MDFGELKLVLVFVVENDTILVNEAHHRRFPAR